MIVKGLHVSNNAPSYVEPSCAYLLCSDAWSTDNRVKMRQARSLLHLDDTDVIKLLRRVCLFHSVIDPFPETAETVDQVLTRHIGPDTSLRVECQCDEPQIR